MAWNSTNKAVGPTEVKQIPYGAPVSTNMANQDRGYYDGWDIERVYKEGVKKVTWVYRCIDAIAGNQARLPMLGRHDNKPDGKVVTDDPILDLLNMRSNPGEDAFAFRYRLSAQLLTSTRGAFVEILWGRGGQPIALNLLPPQYTSPVPDPKKFVSSFQVHLPGQQRQFLKPENVLWFKHPHPLDPYLSMTPLESAGVAVEIEVLAKFYNRSFLLNDGRPGGLLVVRGEMDDDDKSELQMRFRGNVQRAGNVSVIASEDGVDFVDTGANPRDAAYIQMRQITKEEILSAFGVPESVIGNAAGRTFSNALEETRVFWLETMPQHLHMLARGFDPLHKELWFDFDTTKVPVLMSAQQENHRFLMQEFQAGVITSNEYRVGTGRKKVDSDLADSMLANPNLAPIGNTEHKMEAPGAAPGGAPGGMPGQGMPGQPMQPPPPAPGAEGAPAESQDTADIGDSSTPEGEPQGNEGQMSAQVGTFSVKQEQFDSEWDVKAEQDADRWVEIMDNALERLFERQQRVVLEKATGAKARKSLQAKELSVAQVFDIDVWNKQMREDIAPLVTAIVKDAMTTTGLSAGGQAEVTAEDVQPYVDEQMSRVEKANRTTQEELAGAILTASALNDDNEDGHPLLKAAIVAIFAHLLAKRRRTIAEHEAQAAYNAGVFLASEKIASGGPDGNRVDVPTGEAGAGGNALPLRKTWITRKDSHVRDAHRLLHGKTVPVGDGFAVDGSVLRFPGDPLAPPSLTMNCRCRLRFGP